MPTTEHQLVPERYLTHKNLPLLLSLALFLFAFLLYQNTVPNGYTVDDPIYYTDNKFVQQGIKGIPRLLLKSTFYGYDGTNDKVYRPLPVLCFAIEHALCGNNPHFNHFVNIAMFSLCCSLLFLVLRRLFNNHPPTIPFMITVLFAAHPIHTEAVASIKGLDEILAFLFSVLTLYFTVTYCDRKKNGFFVLGMGSYLFCLLAKEHGLTLLGVIPLTLYTFRALPLRRIAILTLPFCGVALLYILFRSILLDHFTFSKPLDLTNNTLLAATNHADQLATAFLILGKYLRLLIVPYPLCWDYSYNQIPITTWLDPRSIASLITYLGLLVIGIFGMRKKSPIAYGILFFLLTFSLSSNLFIKIGVTIGERLLFTPSLGFCIAIVFLFLKTGPIHRRLISAAVGGIMVILYTITTIDRNADWRDNPTLLAADISKNSHSAKARYYWANVFFDAGHAEKNNWEKTQLLSHAIAEYKQSIAIYPESADSWNNLGSAYDEINQKENALEAYQKAIAIKPKNTLALNNLGTIYAAKGDLEKAKTYYQKALELDTGYALACTNMGAVNYSLKAYTESLRWYEKAIRLNPPNEYVLRKINEICKSLKDTIQAQQFFATAKSTEKKCILP
jgi:protein O-mannosyl-transferase